MNVLPGENGYPATIEVTLPAGDDGHPLRLRRGRRWWRSTRTALRLGAMQDNGAGGILYAGDYVREDIDAGRHDHRILLRPQASGQSWRQAGAVEAVKAVVDYCTEHYGALSFGAGEQPEAHPEPGGRRRLCRGRSQPAGRGGLHRRQPGRYAAKGGGSRGGHDPRAGPPVVGTGQYVRHRRAQQPLVRRGTDRLHHLPHRQGSFTARTTPGSTISTSGSRRWTTTTSTSMSATRSIWRCCRRQERLQISNSLSPGAAVLRDAPENFESGAAGGRRGRPWIRSSTTLFNRELDPMYPYLTYQEFLDACGLTEEDLNLA